MGVMQMIQAEKATAAQRQGKGKVCAIISRYQAQTCKVQDLVQGPVRGLEAHPRHHWDWVLQQREVRATDGLGVQRSYSIPAVSPACPICLGRQKRALTRYNCRCVLKPWVLWLQ